MDVRILGPFEVVTGGENLALGGRRQRAVLAVLALHANEVVATDRLADLVWNGEPPEGVRTTLQGYVFQLRKALAGTAATIETRRPGYILTIDPSCIDSVRFARLVDDARTARADGAPAVVSARLKEALALWRGPALADFEGELFAEAEASRLDELRLTVTEERVEADLALGRHAELVAELESLVHAHPLREGFTGQLMRALHGSGRTAEALRAYQACRTVLGEELGIDPSMGLQKLEKAILLQDPSVEREAPGEPRAVGNLPAPLTTFVGRDRELDDVTAYLQRARLVTLTGPGGSGKTRLALAAGGQAVARHADGVWLVELANITDPDLVIDQIAISLGVTEDNERSMRSVVIDWLRRRDVLLIVDNCEHVLDAAAHAVDDLLRSCAHLRVLATSREALSLAGELAWPVPALPLPPTAEAITAVDAMRYGAVCLFMDRAGTAAPGWQLSDENVAAVVDVCSRLDGMPLAIELAAARLRVVSVDQIAARLDNRFKLLTGGSRTAVARQRTLRAAIDWSYETLSLQEQALFTRLSVFAGGFGVERAEAVGAGAPVDDDALLDLLDGLVAKSLVSRVERHGHARYRLVETIRHYGLERLAERGELDATRARHADVLCDAAESEAAKIGGPDQTSALTLLEDEAPDHRAALEWMLTHDRGEQALRMTVALWRFWDHRHDTSEGRLWLVRALEAAPDPTPMRLAALVAGAYLGFLDADLSAATAWCEEGIAIADVLGDTRSRGRLMVRLAEVVRVHGADPHKAEAMCHEAIELLHTDGDRWGEAQARWRLTLLAWDRCDLNAATAFASQCLHDWESEGDMEHAAGARALLAGIARDRGDLDRAAMFYEQSLDDFRAVRDPNGAAQMVLMLASVAAERGEVMRAKELSEESLELHEAIGDTRGIARSLLVAADAALLRGDGTRADRLARDAAARMRERGFTGDLPLALTALARVALARNDYSRVDAWCQEALQPYRSGGPRRHAAPALVVQARARCRMGDAVSAAEIAEEARTLFDAAGDERGIARSLEALAEASINGEQPERAATYLSAARRTRRSIGAELIGDDLDAHHRVVAAVHDAVDGTPFGRAWLEDWDDVVVDLTRARRETRSS